ncbi:Protein GLUTAMINE DUMPER 3 [Stylosanthes scabra]|uniref:Protein GLUTAMINE DUMPER 3 n=1 Tax=Stylosanthes scabra TaxID=79078 RepID=A0ABU6QV49_9FABA|nr:Protein GLUTAMINE DUMPER 3 [Stylosanthes scabra]
MAAAYREPMNAEARGPSSSSQVPHSAWHSPVPYLFGGLAAMLGLIAFALLILACSYWKLSGYLEGNGEGERDLEAGDGKGNESQKQQQGPYEEKILVIMAGQDKPTFLATPLSSNTTRSSSSFPNNTNTCTCDQSLKSEDAPKQGNAGTGTGTGTRDDSAHDGSS